MGGGAGGRGGQGMGEGGGRERRRRARWKTKARDTVEVNTIGTEPNAPLGYDTGSKHHRLNMSKMGGNGGRLYIYIYIYILYTTSSHKQNGDIITFAQFEEEGFSGKQT